MAHDAAAAGGVVAVSALQGRCQPQPGHYLQQMRVERQGDDAICKSSRGRGPLSQRTAHRVWSEPEEYRDKSSLEPVALAVAQTPGSAGYARAVLAQLASFQPGSKRLEAMGPVHALCVFQGF